ncbi:hypothetical protein F5148DRAFT_1231864 [Russula earlei]|uniref:Uncharacterized protein n=1 Tax=Russula earlei TaxID=71964 RepID=A0ACC0TYN0_9AGAM|nr:hypothetical protein F5148DRAFT_1231864 [Russula earlei]
MVALVHLCWTGCVSCFDSKVQACTVHHWSFVSTGPINQTLHVKLFTPLCPRLRVSVNASICVEGKPRVQDLWD